MYINTYDEYGIPGSAGNDITTRGRFRYTGQAWIPELGMYHYKARMYSPTLGRFMQTDPIGYEDQFNLYAYGANDPINNVDPDGEAIETVWDVANIAIGVASAAGNVAAGNYGKAAVDVVGVVVDTAAAVVPGVPGGAGTAIRAARGGEQAVRAVRVGDRVRGALPTPPTGRGAVPRSERDPKRTFSPSERAAKREEQGGRCANNSCGRAIDQTNSEGHHIERHADGGRTTPENHAELCRDCHREIHKPK